MTPATPGGQGRFGDILAGMAHQLEMASGDGERLRQLGNQIQSATGFFSRMVTPEGMLRPDLWTTACSGLMGSPIPIAKFIQSTAQSIPNATETVVTFDQRQFAYNCGPLTFDWSSGTPTKIFTNLRQWQLVVVLGYAIFASNATGWRTAFFHQYDSDDTHLGGDTMVQMPPASGVETVVPFASCMRTASSNSYLTFAVYQNSGAALNLTGLRVLLVNLW